MVGQEGMLVLQQLLLVRSQEGIIGLLSQISIASTLRVLSTR
jgi:hypothetical protein